MDLELVPPSCHRSNAVKVVIRDFKSHFLSVLVKVAVKFPLQFWDRLLPQSEITINLLQWSNDAPTVSAYAHICAALSTTRIFFLRPWDVKYRSTRRLASVALGNKIMLTGGTSPRCLSTTARTHVTSRQPRVSDTMQFKYKHITNPTVTHANMKALSECIATI